MKNRISFFILLICFGSFAQQKDHLFSLIPARKSGIKFENTLRDDKDRNILLYSNFYGGAGIGIGDFNNDGLKDIFFAGNIVNDELYINKGDLQFEDPSASLK